MIGHEKRYTLQAMNARSDVTEGLRINRSELLARFTPTQRRMAREAQLSGDQLRAVAVSINHRFTQDDRVRCHQCARFKELCGAAYEGLMPRHVMRHFHPVPDILRRCEWFEQS